MKNIGLQFLLSLFLSMPLSIAYQENNTDGLQLTVKKIREEYFFAVEAMNMHSKFPTSGTGTIEASKGYLFVTIEVDLKNSGSRNCVFYLDDFHLSSEKDSLYPTHTIENYNYQRKIEIPPNKERREKLVFQFPENATPKELFIDDKRYKVEIIKKRKKRTDDTSNIDAD